nr:Gag-Pol polyprotein [Tanacetum cinerariifolium]
MTSLADKAILLGADNRLQLLEKDMYDSWKSRMELYMLNRQHGRMILESVENGPLLWLTVEENEVTRPKKYYELSATEAIQVDCDVKATNIILQGLLVEYASQVQSSTPLLITYPSNDFQSSVNHNVYNPSSSIPQVEYAPAVHQQSDFSQPDTGLVVLVFQKGSPITRTERVNETYKNVSQEIRDQLNAEAKAVQIIITEIDNDIYSTVDACPNAYEMWKKIYKPTNNNLRTSSNTSRANQDNSPSINRNAGYENQRIGNVAGARETVGSSVVQKSRIQCYNCKEFRHVARECQKPKRAKDAAYHREKMLLCKQEEAGIQLNAEQADWRVETDDDELED